MKKLFLIFLITGLSQLKAQMPFEFIALTVDLDNGADSIISFSNDSSYSTHWQIGPPNKTVFNMAWSPSNAIVTDTLNVYLPNTYTYFDIPFVPNNYLPFNESICPLNICFQHQLDIDEGHAGAWINVRDNDEFMNIAEFDWTNDISGTNYYYSQIQTDNGYTAWDSIYTGESGFQYSTVNWQEVCYSMFWIGVSPPRSTDTMYFRFNFISDSTANLVHDGWMIDDIQIGKGFGNCGGGIEDELNSSIILFPNPADEFVQVHFMNEFNKGSYEIVDLAGRTVLNSNIQYGETVPIRTNLLASGTYFIRFNLDGKHGVKKLFKR